MHATTECLFVLLSFSDFSLCTPQQCLLFIPASHVVLPPRPHVVARTCQNERARNKIHVPFERSQFLTARISHQHRQHRQHRQHQTSCIEGLCIYPLTPPAVDCQARLRHPCALTVSHTACFSAPSHTNNNDRQTASGAGGTGRGIVC
jgi:hypothetical protein